MVAQGTRGSPRPSALVGGAVGLPERSKPTEQRSLLGEILDWMLAPLLLLWPMSVAVTWFVAQGISNRPYDRDLGDIVRALSSQVQISVPAEASEPLRSSIELPRIAEILLRNEDDDRTFFQVLGARGEFLAGDFDLPVPAADMAPGLELQFRDDVMHGVPVRVAFSWLSASGRPGEHAAMVQVASTLNKRSRLATEIVKGVILPQFVILPVAVVLVWLALWRGIAPLARLQERIRQRESTDLSPIPERDVPDEVAPLVRSINDLLDRLDKSMSSQKHFLADAAHQMKTPLAGLRMQAELALRQIDRGEIDPESLSHSLRQIAISSQRAARMVNQLLSMARAEDREQALRAVDVDLADLTIDTVRDFVPQALEKRIDLGYEGPAAGEGAMLRGQPVLLRELIRNLVDNALQYTPAGGSVTARVTRDPFGQVVVLQVEDTGPGIPPGERENVLRPFYRTLGSQVDGSGLGLSIVNQIARQHRAEVSIGAAHEKRGPGGVGAVFTIRFPLNVTDQSIAAPPP